MKASLTSKRTFVFGTLVLALMFVIAACSPGAAPPPAATSAPAPTTAPAATSAPAPTTAPAATSAPSAAADEWGTVTIKKGDTIKASFSAALTGDLASFGLDMQLGANMAAKEFGADINGFALEIVSEDDQCSGPGGTTIANKIVANPALVGHIGFMCSSGEIPGTEILDKAHILSISPSATAVQVTARGLPSVFRTAFNDKVQGPADANFVLNELGLKKAAIMHDGSPYGQGLSEAFAEAFAAGGGQIIGDTEAVTVGEKDFRAALTKIAAGQPEIIFFGGFWPEAAVIATQMEEVGLADAALMSADGTFSADFITNAGTASDGVYASFGSSRQGASYSAFVEAYQAEGGDPKNIVFSPQTYDAVNVLVEALKASATVDANGDLVVGRKALADAVRATTVEGTTGAINFDENGDRPPESTDVVINQVKDGAWVQVYPLPQPTPTAGASAGALPDLGGRALQVGSDTTYPPFESVDANGDIVGFDIEIINAICAKINCSATFVTTDFQGIFAALAQGRFDMVASGVTITDERKQTVDFSLPMMKNTQVMLVRADETRIASTEDLKKEEIRVAVQNGTTNEITSRALVANPDSQIKLFDDFNLAVAAVLNQQADVVVIDTFAGSYLLDANAGKVKTVGDQFGDETLGYVFKKGDTELIDAFNAGLKSVVADGTYKTLCEKWWSGITPAPDCTASGLEISQ